MQLGWRGGARRGRRSRPSNAIRTCSPAISRCSLVARTGRSFAAWWREKGRRWSSRSRTGTPLAEWNILWGRPLDRGHRVIAFDQRGHGRSTIGSAGIGSESMAADDAAVLEHFEVHDGVLVGHSTGGFIAIRALVEHPELAGRLRGLVLCATWVGRILSVSTPGKFDARRP
ncbi:alpha/beta fold hydrolase [Mycobacterium sp. URHB0021]